MSTVGTSHEEHVARALERLEQGAQAVAAYVLAWPAEERGQLCFPLQRALFNRCKSADDLDFYVDVMRRLIDAGIGSLGNVGDGHDSDDVKDTYNMLSYNLAADLCDCWPDDVLPRERRHFEAGLRAAEDCVRWRNELNKPPRNFSKAFWAKGMHLLSLGHYNGAVKSFALALGFAQRAEQEAGLAVPLGPASSFDVLLNTCFLGIAEQLDGHSAGAQRYAQGRDAFERQTATTDAEVREEAEYGLQELDIVVAKYLNKA
jgi:hypothetical protein